jgi:hypothetical protein
MIEQGRLLDEVARVGGRRADRQHARARLASTPRRCASACAGRERDDGREGGARGLLEPCGAAQRTAKSTPIERTVAPSRPRRSARRRASSRPRPRQSRRRPRHAVGPRLVAVGFGQTAAGDQDQGQRQASDASR